MSGAMSSVRPCLKLSLPEIHKMVIADKTALLALGGFQNDDRTGAIV